MATIQITLTIETDEIPCSLDISENGLELLLHDALGEFCAQRGINDMQDPAMVTPEQARKYVEHRYEGCGPWLSRDEKCGEVARRCAWAIAMKNADVEIEKNPVTAEDLDPEF